MNNFESVYTLHHQKIATWYSLNASSFYILYFYIDNGSFQQSNFDQTYKKSGPYQLSRREAVSCY